MNRSRVGNSNRFALSTHAHCAILARARAFDNRHGSLEHCDHLRSELYTQ